MDFWTYLVFRKEKEVKKSISVILFTVSALLVFSCGKGPLMPDPKSGALVVRGETTSEITGFGQDNASSIWMLTNRDGLYRLKGGTLLHYVADSTDAKSLSSNSVNAIATDPEGNIWVGTRRGVDRFDEKTDSFIYYEVDSYEAYVRDILFDSEGGIYARTWRAIFKLDELSRTFKLLMDFRTVTQDQTIPLFDDSGQLWVHYGNTLIRFDRSFERDLTLEPDCGISDVMAFEDRLLLLGRDGKLRCLSTYSGEEVPLPYQLTDLSSQRVQSISHAGTGNLVFRTSDGMAVYDSESGTLDATWLGLSVLDKVILEESGDYFLLDSSSNLWYSVQDGGFRVVRFQQNEGSPHHELLSSLRGRYWNSSASDDRYLWLLLSDNSLLTYDLQEKEIKDISPVSDILGASFVPFQMNSGARGRLLLSGFGRTDRSAYLLKTGDDGRPYLECRYTAPETMSAALGSDGSIWGYGVGSKFFHAPAPEDGVTDMALELVEGLPSVNEISYVVMNITLADGRIVFGLTNNNPIILDPSVMSVKEIPVSASRYQVYWTLFLQDREGDIWIGSRSMGLFRYIVSEDRVEVIPKTETTGCSSIFEDSKGDMLFLCDDRRMYRWNRADGSVQLLWSDDERLSTSRWILALPDGESYMCDGQSVFSVDAPSEEELMLDEIPLMVTFATDDREIVTIPTTVFDKNHRYSIRLKSLTLSPVMFLSVGRSGIGHSYDYHISVNRSGEMKRVSSHSSEMPLHSLNYGVNRIRFGVGSSVSGYSTPEYTLLLSVRRPLWLHAIRIAVLLLLAALGFVFRSMVKKKNEARREREERELQEKLNMQNIDSFANISHEFRSPLTLINAALTSIEGDETPEGREKAVSMARRNVSRMLNLTSQLMDFNKLVHGKMSLHVAPRDVSSLVKKCVEVFEVGAGVKSVDLHLTGCEEERPGWVDEDKLEKILWNLCSNALKFTPPGGEIDVDCLFNDGVMTVKVLDTGIGLEEDKIPHLFERFSQSESGKQMGGTGIGLFYTKSLVELHHGTITGANREDAQGSVFTFSIPIGESYYNLEEKSFEEDPNSVTVSSTASSSYAPESSAREDEEKLPTVLVIDDDYEMVYYLKSFLSKKYKVVFRFDALSGYNIIKKESPDVIVCDIMMMDMNGLEFCRRVKENLEICHIPVVMLTARSSVADQVSALEMGADAYVVKPFDPDYLMALVGSLIDNRLRLKQFLSFSTETQTDDLQTEGLSPRDRQFMEKVYASLEENLSNGEVDIDTIASNVGVSRSKLFYKIKALTGHTPGDFFTLYKLNRAAQLLKEDKYKISAVAAMVGFNSSSHFSAQFKKRFGVLPSQFVQDNAGAE